MSTPKTDAVPKWPCPMMEYLGLFFEKIKK